MPIYILNKTNAGKKIRCPERDLNPRHPDLMTGALTTELPRQPHWSESNIGYKGNIDYQTFAPRPLGLGITSVGRRDMLIGPDVIDHTNVYHGIFRTNCSPSERSTLICYLYIKLNKCRKKNQMPRAGFEPTTPRSHDRCSNH